MLKYNGVLGSVILQLVFASMSQGADAYSFTGPASGPTNSISSSFVVTPNGAYTGTITIRPLGGKVSKPVVLTFSNSSTAQVFTIIPTAVGPVILTATNNGSLANPPALSYNTPPSAPAIGTATAGNNSATVAFSAPASTGGLSITTYRATCGNLSNTGSASPILVSGLSAGSPYTCSVTATNAAGTSASSNISNSIIPTVAATGYTLTGPASGAIGNVSGNFVVTPNGLFTGTITVRPSGNLSPVVLTFSNSSTAQVFTIIPTAVGPVILTATNNGSLANPPALSYNTPPSAPAIGTATAGNNSATVAFSAPASTGGLSITTYRATCGNLSNTGSASPILVSGLSAGSPYTCSVTATNAAGTSASSNISNSIIPTVAATGYTLTGPASGAIGNVSGNFVVTPNGLFTGTITVRPSGNLSPVVLTFSNSSTAQVFTIIPTAVGPVILTATNNGSLANPPALSYNTPPSAPAIGTATAGNNSATVAFSAPASTGGLSITTYRATCGNLSNTGSASPILVSGLSAGSPYTCSVTATNAAGTSASSNISNSIAISANSITSVMVPAHGSDYTLFNSQNVFSLTNASRYPDGTVGDWVHWVATSRDPTQASNGVFFNAQDITIRNRATSPKISDLSYTGVTGPAFSQFASNAFFDWDKEDNDNSEIDYSGPYFYFTGNGYPFVRPHGSSYMVINCANPGATLIANCSESFTVTPAHSGPQNLYVWTHADGTNVRLTVSAGSNVQIFDLPSHAQTTMDEAVITVPLSPTDTSTIYTVRLSAVSLQSGTTQALLSFTSAALGGATAGNISDAVLATPGYIGTPSHTYGVRIHQADPFMRIPAAIISRTLSPTESLQTAINAALCGTDLHLPLGYVSNERITLIEKGCTDARWIRIIADGAPATFGRRADPSDYPGGPNSPALLNWSGPEDIISNDAMNPDRAARAAHHYAFVGLEITSIKTTYSVNYRLISFNAGSGPTMASISHDIIFQNCYVHRHSSQENSLNGIEFNVDRGAIYDSYIAGFQGNTNSFANENHAIYLDSTNGPLTFRNNYLSAATECVITGGVPASPFVITKDIEFDGNFFDKPSSYNTQPYQPYDVKNSLEFKEGQFVTVSNNVFEHGFAGYGQVGQAVFIRSYAFGGVQRRTTSNYAIINNIIRHHTVGIMVEAIDYYGLGGSTGSYAAKTPLHFTPRQYDILVSNNVMEDLSALKWGSVGRGQSSGANLLYLSGLPVNLTIDHNTGLFDSTNDNNAGYQDADHSILVPALSVLSASETRALGYAPTFNTAPDEAIASFVMSNNLLGGGIHGDCYFGTYLLPSGANYSNNLFFNVPGYIGQTFSSHPIAGLSYTSSVTAPLVPGMGVDYSALPNDCAVMTGGRKESVCTSGQ